jgi:nucleoside permease NupC
MQMLHSACGYVALLGLAWLCGRRTRQLQWQTIILAILTQVVLAGLLLRTGVLQPLFHLGGVGGIAPSRRPDLARLGLRALLSGNIATMLSGAVAGLYV